MNKKIASIGFLFTTFLWGLTFVFVKLAVNEIPPYEFLFYRFLVAALCLIAISPKLLSKLESAVVKQGVLLGLLLGATVLFQTIGLQYINASTASFITGTSIIYVTLIVALQTKTMPSLTALFGVGCALIGLGIVTLHAGDFVFNKGDIFVSLCAICFAFYIIYSKHVAKKDKAVALTFIQIVTIASVSLGLSLLDGHYKPIFHSLNAWIGILYCGVFATGVAFYLQLRCQEYITAQKSSVIFAMEPVFATIGAVLILNEQLSTSFFIGSGLILAGMLML